MGLRDSDMDISGGTFGLLDPPTVNGDDYCLSVSSGGGVFLSDWFTASALLSTYNSAWHTAMTPQIFVF